MNLKALLEIGKELYAQRPEETMQFANTVADFLMDNRDNPAVVDPRFSHLIEPLHNLWAINALPEIADGRVFISEALINTFLGTQIKDNDSFKSVDVNCYGSGTIDCLVEHSMGRFLIKAEILECVHDQKKSNLVLCINDKKVMSSGGLQKLLASVTMTLANNFLGKYLNQTLRSGVKLIYGSDVLTVDFAALLKNSELGQYMVDDKPAVYIVTIQKATVVDGGIELSLKYNVPD
ncbi:MAG: hypothetical protein IJ523_03050 [Succinivibrionaceae bacterium]|nr:hypothetical protein [Succinivibrionaceae bacterium]